MREYQTWQLQLVGAAVKERRPSQSGFGAVEGSPSTGVEGYSSSQGVKTTEEVMSFVNE